MFFVVLDVPGWLPCLEQFMVHLCNVVQNKCD